jgi:ABC-2 type transport system ATP-binding protein
MVKGYNFFFNRVFGNETIDEISLCQSLFVRIGWERGHSRILPSLDFYGHNSKPIESLMTNAVELINLSKQFGNHEAVRRLHLQIPMGCFYALLGTNGAGKTTTLRMVSGLAQPDQGDALICGHSITRHPIPAKQVMAYIPDEPFFYEKLRPLEYLELIAGLWQIPSERAFPYAKELLERLGISERQNEFIESFPRGIRQRLAFAGAFIHEPKVMLLDEPLTGIDATFARLVKDMLREYVQQGNTVIMTTHIMEIAEQLADRIGIMSEGMLLADGTLGELRSQAGQANSSLEEVFIQLTQLI